MWAGAALVSALVDGSHSSLLIALFGYLTPVLIAFAAWRVSLPRRDHELLVAALAIGLAVPMSHGIVVYLSEWGIPSLEDLFWSKYDLGRMARYQEVTFGSTTRTAALLVLTMPVIFASLILRETSYWLRFLLLTSFLVSIGNLIIVQSRTAFAAILLILLLATWRFGRLWILAGLLSALVFGAYVLSQHEEFERIADHYVQGIQLDAEIDTSLQDRVESIEIGWRIFADNPLLGVGPGQSRLYNEYFVAHQLHVAQASELGFIGLAAMLGLTIVVLTGYATTFLKRHYMRPYAQVWMSGSAAWVLAGTVGNMPISGTLLSTWGGLFACFAALGLGAMRADEHSSKSPG